VLVRYKLGNLKGRDNMQYETEDDAIFAILKAYEEGKRAGMYNYKRVYLGRRKNHKYFEACEKAWLEGYTQEYREW
jgi:hypothetical protein